MRLLVTGSYLDYGGVQYKCGDEFDVPDENAAQWRSTGLVAPVSGEWRDGLREAPTEPPRALPEPAAPTPPHELCKLPDKPRPRAYVQVCTVHGCPCQTWGGRCPACKKAARSKRAAKEKRSGHNDPRWRAFSKSYLRQHDTCACEECLTLPEIIRPTATVLNHRDGLGPNGPRGYDPANLQPMTAAHHNKLTAREQPGGWADRH